MKRALAVVATTAAAAALLVGGTGSTMALWQTGSPLEIGAITAGHLGMRLERVESVTASRVTDPSCVPSSHENPAELIPGSCVEFRWQVTPHLDGDNLNGQLRFENPPEFSVGTGPLRDVLDLELSVKSGTDEIVRGTFDQNTGELVDEQGVPQVVGPNRIDSGAALDVTLSVQMDENAPSAYLGLRLTEELWVTFEQTREAFSGAGSWAAYATDQIGLHSASGIVDTMSGTDRSLERGDSAEDSSLTDSIPEPPTADAESEAGRNPEEESSTTEQGVSEGSPDDAEGDVQSDESAAETDARPEADADDHSTYEAEDAAEAESTESAGDETPPTETEPAWVEQVLAILDPRTDLDAFWALVDELGIDPDEADEWLARWLS